MAISLTSFGTAYTQNFDTLPITGSVTWVNDSTLPGWYTARTGTGTNIVAGTGSAATGDLHSFGRASVNVTDRALGSVGSVTAGDFYWGVAFTNNTGATITSLQVSYIGEQWRDSGDTNAQTVSFSYLIGSPTVLGSLAEFQSAGVAVQTLDFTSPSRFGYEEGGGGYLLQNRIALGVTITGLSIASGTEFMLRWSDPDHAGADHGLSIDDFSLTAFGANTAPRFGTGNGKITTPVSAADDYGGRAWVQSDGKIVVAGSVGTDTSSDFAVVRYNADGSLDTTFGSTGKVTTSFNTSDGGGALEVQPDGKIVVGGYVYNGVTSDFALVRYNADGSLDTTFGTGGKVTTAVVVRSDQIFDLLIRPDGKIVAAGYSDNGSNYDFALVRYNVDGSLDTTFGTGGKVITAVGTRNEDGNGVTIQPDGKIIVAGYSQNSSEDFEFALVRYNANGSLDTSFGSGGKVTTSIAGFFDVGYDVQLQPDGKIVVTGLSSNGTDHDFGLVRYDTDGSLDTTFGSGGKVTTPVGPFYDWAQSVVIQPDGKIVVAGYGDDGSLSNNDFELVRYNANGSLDTTFGTGGKVTTAVGPSDDRAFDIQIQPDGKLVVVGRSYTNPTYDFAVVRYNTDGSLDATFGATHMLDGSPLFAGTPAVLDADVQVYDADLHGIGYAGATLTLARHGGAASEDVFSAKSGGNLSALTDGGALVLSGVTIGTVTQNSGGTLILRFNSNATEARVNEAMQSIAYANTSPTPLASVQIDWAFSDGNAGAQGSGGPLFATGSTTVSIALASGTPPNVAASSGTTAATEQIAEIIDSAVAVSDSDSTTLASARVSITAGFRAGEDVLGFSSQNGISGSYNAATGVLTLTGSASVASYQTALRSVTYTDTSDTPGTTTRTVSFVVNDGVFDSTTSTKQVSVASADDVPVVSASPGTTAGIEQIAQIVDSAIVVSDPDSTTLTSAKVSITVGLHAGEDVLGFISQNGITGSYNVATGILNLTGSASVANYQTALRSVTYTDTSDTPDTTTRTVSFMVNDGVLDSTVSAKQVSVAAIDDNPGSPTVNVAPVNTVPGTQEIEANTATAIAGLSIGDADAGAGFLTTTLSVQHGTLAVAALGGATVSGSGSATVTIAGKLAQINATLAGSNVVYKGAHDFFGTDTLTVATNDNGNTGTGGPLSDTAPVTIHLNTLIGGTPGNNSYTALPGQEMINGLSGLDTITFDFRLVDAIVSYEGSKVIVDGPSGSHTVLTGFEVFKFTDGTVNTNDGDWLVDDLFYFSRNHDVWRAGADADDHFHAFGWHEARDPNAFFSTSTYLSANPDVKAAGADPLTHFDQYGWWENRMPSVNFDPAAYLAANPDVKAAGIDPLMHFLQFGAGEGRQPFAPADLFAPSSFDFVYYLSQNPDVAAAHVDPLLHFQQYGWHEGRDPNAFFDTSGYLATYTDVAAAGVIPLDHYNAFGWHEGRDPSTDFDTHDYLMANRDVAAAHVNPLLHFLYYGQAEGRSPQGDGMWG